MTKHNTIDGSGILNDFVNKTLDFGNNIAKKLIRNGYNNQSTRTIKEYGNWRIFKLNVYRKPVEGMLEKALNLISLGKFNDGKEAGGFQAFYHLGLFCVLGNERGTFVNVICEKNEVIHIEKVSFNLDKYATSNDIMPVAIKTRLTLGELLDNAQRQLGDKYFYYDAFGGNNCQTYCRSLLSGSGLLTPKLDSFVFQSLEEVIKHIPSVSQKIAHSITNLGGLFNNLLGKGKPRKTVKGGRRVQFQLHSNDKMLDADIPDAPVLADDEKINTDNLFFDLDGNLTDESHNAFAGKTLRDMRKRYAESHLTEGQIRGRTKTRDYKKEVNKIGDNVKKGRQDELDNEAFWNDFKNGFFDGLNVVGNVASAIPIPVVSNLGEALNVGTSALQSAVGGSRTKTKKAPKRVHFK